MSAQSQPSAPRRSTLTELDVRLLDFERDWTSSAATKEEAIRAQFSLSVARYYQLLNVLIDSPDAVRHDPMLVKRLQRARDLRIRSRVTRTFGNSDHSETVSRERDEESND